MSGHERYLQRLQSLVNERLGRLFTEDCPQRVLTESMRYSLLAGGKRIRPVLVLAFCAAAGGDELSALDAACAVELLHTYSLIHDDLPCMDDDDLRRGQPTNHMVYGECIATLAGDALQAEAFSLLLGSPLPPDRICRMAGILAEAAGVRGICGGQTLDMQGEGKKLGREELENIHRMKTAAMLRAAALIGVCAAGGSDTMRDAAAAYADGVGLAFQIRDDMLDALGDEETLGKPIGSDDMSGKSTFFTLYGKDECQRLIDSETERAAAALSSAFEENGFLTWLAWQLAGRKS